MVFIKKLKGGRQIISHQKMKGSGLKVKTLNKILQATYENREETPFNIDNEYFLEPTYSTDEVKVYVDDKNDKVVVAVRGTKITNPQDILTDLNLGGFKIPELSWGSLNLLSYVPSSLNPLATPPPPDDTRLNLMDKPRFRSAKQVLDDVIKFYHNELGYKIDVIGHSLGGKVAYEISRNEPSNPTNTSLRPEINNVITVNSAGTFNDSKTINPPNKYDIRSTEDFLQQFKAIPPQPYIDPITGIPNTYILNLTQEEKDKRELNLASQSFREAFSPSTYPPYLEHKIDILNRIPDQEQIIGSGVNKNKINQYVNFILGVPK